MHPETPVKQEPGDPPTKPMTKTENVVGPTTYTIPYPESFPTPEEYEPVEQYIVTSILTKHNSQPNTTINHTLKKLGVVPNRLTVDNRGYKALLLLLKKCDEPRMLFLLCLVLTHNGTALNILTSNPKCHAHLLHALFRMNPFGLREKPKDPTNANAKAKPTTELDLVDAHLGLIVSIVSSNTTFLIPALELCGRLLTVISSSVEDTGHDKPIKQDPSIPNDAETEGIEPRTTHAELLHSANIKAQRIHATLYSLRRLVPSMNTSSSALITSLQRNFGMVRYGSVERMTWLARQCFEILSYFPEMEHEWMTFMINVCLEIDVEISIGKLGEVKLVKSKKKTKKEETVLESLEEEEEEKVDVKQKVKKEKDVEAVSNVNEMADKLDSIMHLVFDHIRSRCIVTTSRNKDGSIRITTPTHTPLTYYQQVLSPIFSAHIFNTHKSKFVQFLLFYVCSLPTLASASLPPKSLAEPNKLVLDDGAIYREFCTNFLSTILDQFQPPIARQCSACYLSSFISRAKYVNTATAAEVVSALLQYAELYIQAHANVGANGTQTNLLCELDKADMLTQHGVYYAVTQGAFYIMCFRGIEIHHWYQSHKAEYPQFNFHPQRWVDIGWNASKLNLHPFRYCFGPVKREFLHLMEDLYGLNEEEFVPPGHTCYMQPPIDEKVKKELIKKELVKKEGVDATTTKSAPPSIPKRKRIVKKRRGSMINTSVTQMMAASETNLHARSRLSLLGKKSVPQESQPKKRSVKTKGGFDGDGSGSNPLDSFFPFDPYLLRHSYVEFIEPLYRNWEDGEDVDVDVKHEQNQDPKHNQVQVKELDDEDIKEEEMEQMENEQMLMDTVISENYAQPQDGNGDTAAVSPSSAGPAYGVSAEFHTHDNENDDTEMNDDEQQQLQQDEYEDHMYHEMKRYRANSVGSF